MTDENWSVSLQAALDKMQNNDLSAALEILLEVATDESHNKRVINIISDCYYYLGEFDRAYACWQEVLNIDPNDQEAKNKLGRFRTPGFQSWLKKYRESIYNIEQKNYAAALALLRELMEENDGFVSVYQLLGWCYMVTGEKQKAKVVWEKGLELDISNEALLEYLEAGYPDRPEKQDTTLLRDKTVINETEAGDISSESFFQKHSRTLLGATGILCLALLLQGGMLLNNTRNENTSTPEIREAITKTDAGPEDEIDDNNAVADIMNYGEETSMEGSNYDFDREKHYYNEGYQAYKDGNYKTAIDNLSVVVSMQSDDYINREALYYLARTYYLDDDYANAEKYYLEYINLFPGTNYHDDSLFYLAVVYNATGNKDKAVQSLNELKKISPNCGYESSELYKQIMAE